MGDSNSCSGIKAFIPEMAVMGNVSSFALGEVSPEKVESMVKLAMTKGSEGCSACLRTVHYHPFNQHTNDGKYNKKSNQINLLMGVKNAKNFY